MDRVMHVLKKAQTHKYQYKKNNNIKYLTHPHDPGVGRVMPPGGIASSLDWHRLVTLVSTKLSTQNFDQRHI